MATKNLNILLSEETLAKLEQVAAAQGSNAKALAREAVHQYLIRGARPVSVLHVTAGNDQWTPTPKELDDLAAQFKAATLAGPGNLGVVVTRNSVVFGVQEIEQPSKVVVAKVPRSVEQKTSPKKKTATVKPDRKVSKPASIKP